MIYKGLIH